MPGPWETKAVVLAAKVAVLLSFLVIGASALSPDGAAAGEPPVAAYSLDAGEGTVAEDLVANTTARSKAPPGSTTAASAPPSPSMASMIASLSPTPPTSS